MNPVSGVLTVAEVQAIVETPVGELPVMVIEDPSVLAALARSHEQLRERLLESEIAVYDVLAQIEQLRGERDAAKEQFWQQRHEWAAATGDNQRIIDAALAKAEAAVRAGGEAADALRKIATLSLDEDLEMDKAQAMARLTMQSIAREALAALEPDEEVDLLPSPEGHGDGSSPGYYEAPAEEKT